jgi:hypothetical protein
VQVKLRAVNAAKRSTRRVQIERRSPADARPKNNTKSHANLPEICNNRKNVSATFFDLISMHA